MVVGESDEKYEILRILCRWMQQDLLMPWIREVSSVEELEMIPRIWFDYNGKTEWPFIKKKKDIWGEN